MRKREGRDAMAVSILLVYGVVYTENSSLSRVRVKIHRRQCGGGGKQAAKEHSF